MNATDLLKILINHGAIRASLTPCNSRIAVLWPELEIEVEYRIEATREAVMDFLGY